MLVKPCGMAPGELGDDLFYRHIQLGSGDLFSQTARCGALHSTRQPLPAVPVLHELMPSEPARLPVPGCSPPHPTSIGIKNRSPQQRTMPAASMR
jgi:hypothetical protein